MDLVEIIDITKNFGAHQALDKVSLSIPENSIFGLLGPNGAGKTSLIRILTQIINADGGSILFKGQQLNSSHISQIGYLPEERGLYKKMKVQEQLVYFGRLRGMDKSEAVNKANFWLDKLELTLWRNKNLEQLSKGMQQKVQFIVAIFHDPKLIILDEPFSGFDPVNSEIITREILALRKQNKTIIFSTHRMETVEALCDNIALIHMGKCILKGQLNQVKNTFKHNIFRLEGSGSIPKESPIYELLKKEDDLEKPIFFLKLNKGYTSNDLLSEVMLNFSISGFQEVLPSMNEIFISQIKEFTA